MLSGGPQTGKRILVTGGAGFIGANLLRMLIDSGYRVTVLDNFSTGRRDYLRGLDIDLVVGDILDVDLVNEAVAGCDGVVHLAAQTGVPGSLADPHRDCLINVVGTLNVLEACRQENVRRKKLEQDSAVASQTGGVPRLVFASSNAPLGRQSPPATEDKAPLPISPYGASKLAGEAYCLAYHGSWGLGTVVLRFGNVYGPYSAHKNSVVAKFVRDVLNRGEITIDGDGSQTRDFIFVRDLCRAIVMALESDVSGEVFQIATGREVSISQLAALIRGLAEGDVIVRHRPWRRGDIRRSYSSIDKIRKILGWEPQVTLEEGLQETYLWLKANGGV